MTEGDFEVHVTGTHKTIDSKDVEIAALKEELRQTVSTAYHDEIVKGWRREVAKRDAQIAELKGIGND